MLDHIARRAAEPAEKLLTTSFRLAGWVAGRAISPVLWGVRQVGPPVLQTVSRVSPAAGEVIGAFLPGVGGTRPDHSTDSWRPSSDSRRPNGAAPVGHVATVPTAAGSPSPAAAHAAADRALAQSAAGSGIAAGTGLNGTVAPKPAKPVAKPAAAKPAAAKPAVTKAAPAKPAAAKTTPAKSGPTKPGPATSSPAGSVGAAGAAVPSGDLPIENWDGLTIGSIRQRTRSLDAGQIEILLGYERAHAARPAVLLNLENRLAKARGDAPAG